MSPDEAYRIGFLAGCAEDGISGTEAVELYRKTAWLADMTRNGILGALATGTIVGGGIGAGLGIAARPDPLKNENAPLVRNLQQAELIAALHQHAARAKQQAAVLRSKSEQPVRRSVFGI